MWEKDSKNIEPTIETTSMVIHEAINHDNIMFHTYTMKATPQVKHRGRFIILHGWAEHSIMYISQLEFLNELGYDFHIYDQRGSGRTSPGRYRGRSGNSYQVALTDLDFMIEYFSREDDDEINLIGHSMGGSIALSYMHSGKYRTRITSIIVGSPLIRLASGKQPSWLRKKLASLIVSLFPNLKHYEKQTPAGVEVVTNNHKWRQYLLTEESCQPVGTIRQMLQMIDRGSNLLKSVDQVDLDTKLLILQTEEDKIVDYHSSFEYFNRVPLKVKQFVKITNSGHAIFLENDLILEKVKKMISMFLN